jgi:hypothetical protein
MTLDSEVPDGRPVDISFFTDYRYNDWKEFSLRLPVLPIHTFFPADYRDQEHVLAAAKKNIKHREEG